MDYVSLFSGLLYFYSKHLCFTGDNTVSQFEVLLKKSLSVIFACDTENMLKRGGALRLGSRAITS